MNLNRRLLLLGAIACSLSATPGHAQTFPSKPIRIVVPTGPGVSPDIVSRVIGEHLSKAVGQPVVIDNRPGASGMIGAEAVATAAPDGYTVLFGYSGLMAMNPHLYGTARFDPLNQFAAVTHVLNTPFVLTATSSAPYSTLTELAAYAKSRPGEVVYGSAGVGSHSRIATELIATQLGIKMTHVPYQTAPGPDLISGRVQIYLDPVVTAAPLVNAGKVKALAVASATRVPQLPNVPTIAETLPGFASWSMIGFYVPKRTPEPIIATLATEINKVLGLPAVRQRFAEMGYEIVGTTPQEFERQWQEDYKLWGRAIKDAGIKLE